MDIIYSDEYLAVVHKEAGLLTTPAHGEPCLVDLLERELDRQAFGRYRLSVVHRLDKQTSGLLVFARTPAVASALSRQFAAHSVERLYQAIVSGDLASESGSISRPLDGKRATTHYRVLTRHALSGASTTEIEVRLETGRRNQIRRHFAEFGHPIVGDKRFAPDLAAHPAWSSSSLALHARTLGFLHPKHNARMRFEAPVPKTFSIFGLNDLN